MARGLSPYYLQEKRKRQEDEQTRGGRWLRQKGALGQEDARKVASTITTDCTCGDTQHVCLRPALAAAHTSSLALASTMWTVPVSMKQHTGQHGCGVHACMDRFTNIHTNLYR